MATTETVLGGDVSVIVHVPVPSHGPAPHPVKVDPSEGVAVNTTVVPLAKLTEHVAPQLIPAGVLLTVPVPLPPGIIVSRTFVLVITVESDAGGGATDPPPETPAIFTCGELALLATFTVTVIPG